MKNVIFMGCHGYNVNYGGWETFVKNLIDNWDDPNYKFYVLRLANKKTDDFETNGVTTINVTVKRKGSIKMVLMDLKTLLGMKKILKKYNIEKPILYIMGARVGILFWLFKRKLRKLGITTIHNPAGLEWKREKWNWFIKKYIYISHIMLARSVNYLACDSVGMLDVYNKLVKKKKVIKRYIAYGTYKAKPLLETVPKEVADYFSLHGIVEKEYFLVLSRFVPENNYQLVIEQFMKTNTSKKLLIICNHNSEQKFYKKLLKKIDFLSDKRIIFAGPLYDKEILNYVRQKAYGYIHGHSVGGTNPGLLEAMSATDMNILYDCVFNRQVGGDAAFYFDNKENSLLKVIEKSEKMPVHEIIDMGEEAKRRMASLYSWDKIVHEYKSLFDEITDKER